MGAAAPRGAKEKLQRLDPRLALKDEVPFGRRRAMTQQMFLDACERVCEHLLVYTWGGRVAPWVLCSCVRVGVACVPLCLRRAAGFVLARVLRVCETTAVVRGLAPVRVLCGPFCGRVTLP